MKYWLLVTDTWWYRKKSTHATATIFWSMVFPIWVLIIPHSSTRVLCPGYSRILVAKRRETGRETVGEFLPISIPIISQGIFNMPFSNFIFFHFQTAHLLRHSAYVCVCGMKWVTHAWSTNRTLDDLSRFTAKYLNPEGEAVCPCYVLSAWWGDTCTVASSMQSE
jgi:hypothetical protein